jgi:Holliday junction resolvasome RuvABC endonuclease subunit
MPPTPFIALGIDGGLAHMGLAVADVRSSGIRIRWSGVIETERNGTATAADDNVRRAQEVATQLARVIVEHDPQVIYAEAMSHPRDARAAAMLSMSWGVVAAVALRFGIPIAAAGPMPLKAALTGNKVAKKDEMIAAVRAQYPEVEWPRRSDLHEHQADAVAAIHFFVAKHAAPTAPPPRRPGSRVL